MDIYLVISVFSFLIFVSLREYAIHKEKAKLWSYIDQLRDRVKGLEGDEEN